MQRVKIICVGKMSASFLAAGVAEYAKRLSAFCKLDIVEIAEEYVDEKSGSPGMVAAALQKEGQKILAQVPKNALIAALCIEGKQCSSEEFANRLETAALQGEGDVAFIIGSSHGLSEEVKQKAQWKLSLSAMTFPHQMARMMLAEQIYRAFMIRNKSKYHK